MKLTLTDEFRLCRANGTGFDTENLDEAYSFCKSVALGHYENFPVGSVLIKGSVRKHFFAAYAFSRTADDLADEPESGISPDERIAALGRFESLLSSPTDDLRNPIFIALRNTMRRFSIPSEPFSMLIEAFRRDVLFRQADSWDDTIDYCRHSANPVGEIVLRLFGLYTPVTAPLSDAVCTALQLTNFWQDFSRDIPNGRHYIPTNILQKYGFSNMALSGSPLLNSNDSLGELVRELCSYTRQHFERGKLLLPHLSDKRLRMEIAATVLGGESVLGQVEALGSRVFTERPSVSRCSMLWILIKALFY